VQIYGRLFADEMARLLRPAVCAASMMPGTWLPTFPLPLIPHGTSTSAAAAAAVGNQDDCYWPQRWG